MEIYNILLPLLTLIVGSILTYVFTKKLKQSEIAQQRKEEQYSKLLVKLQGFVGQTANKKTKEEFFEEFYKSWLYASDDVVSSINNLVEFIKNEKNPNPAEGRKIIGTIVLAMRKDLNKKSKLTHSDFNYTDVIN
ncbi:hypothetical protein [Hydrogenovibrio marinus]|uniref:Uncharacterized protein n=1 Tax=Hydrogenovibrio marinus TaxID=28885 RepID=A0A067A0B9_HYDMR|nr:hypothetical protein [Hydrogenovibrio marinus]KDN95790.1 hypothetical protein EI16_05710 [Hydrogenovibrio marinus]BBN58723.1 hypothetical protein HVMH_0317 [Hydrogenovibrio marinus]